MPPDPHVFEDPIDVDAPDPLNGAEDAPDDAEPLTEPEEAPKNDEVPHG